MFPLDSCNFLTQASQAELVEKNLPANARDIGDRVQSLDQEDPLEKATHSSILAWEIPWTEEPDGLQSMEFQSVGHYLVTEQRCASSDLVF